MAIDSAPTPLIDDAAALGSDGLRTPLVDKPGPKGRRRVSRLAVAVALLLVFAATFGPMFAGEPTDVDLSERLIEPVGFGGTWDHPLGTDGLGRDVLASLFAGARVSLVVGLGAITLAFVIGVTLGLLAGYRGGVVDSAVSWLVDFQLGFPALLLILLIAAYVRAGIVPLIIMLGMVTWMLFARLARSLALSLRTSDFVAGAQLAGSGTAKILRRHLLPNMLSPLLTLALLEVATAMLGESALSYLGYGITRPRVSWGLMIAEGQQYLRIGWWIMTFPGMMLTIAVLTLHGLARSVRPHGLFIAPKMTTTPLLEIEDLSVEFAVGTQTLTAVRGLTMHIDEAQAVGLVGESACGKSVSMLAVLGLLGSNAVVRGTIRYRGEVIDSPAKVAALRGSQVAMVFQDSANSLNPLMKVGVQVAEAVRRHGHVSRSAAADEAVRYFERVRLPSPRDLYHAYPFELSGGMRQRVMIASALACNPELLIADEPTTGLDVTVQAEILDLLVELRSTTHLAVVFVSHDIGAVGELCEDIYVFYGGRAVEHGPTKEVLGDPRHPYTRLLLESVPMIGDKRRLAGIDGLPPGPHRFPEGCSFSPRCDRAIEGRCDHEPPPLIEVTTSREVECWLHASVIRG